MALASIVKRGNPLYTFQYLLQNGGLSNGVALYSATPLTFGGNIYFLGPQSGSSDLRVASVDPNTHTSTNLITNIVSYGGYIDMGFLQVNSTYGAGVPYTATNFLVVGDCNSSIKVYRYNSDCNSYNATYDLSNVNISIPKLGGMRTICIRQIDVHNATMLVNSVTNTPYGILNAALTIDDNASYTGGGDVRNQTPTTVLSYTSFYDITRIFTTATTFYYVGVSNQFTGNYYNIYYGGSSGSSFTAVTGTTASTTRNVMDATSDPSGNIWFTMIDNTNFSIVYTLNKFVLTNASNGSITYTQTLATQAGIGGNVIGHIPTRGIVIVDDKGNGYYSASDDVYMLKPYYTY
jgi:hypothetical protein